MARLSLARVGALLLTATTALMISALSAAADTTAKYNGKSVHDGHVFNFAPGTKPSATVETKTFELQLADGKMVETYCVELETDIVPGADYVDAPWKDYPATTGGSVAGEVLWVLNHGYPTVKGDALSKKIGQPIDDKQALTATQAAVWYFSSNQKPKIGEGNAPAVVAAYEYFLKNAKPEAEPKGALVISKGADFAIKDGKAGPFVVATNSDKVTLSIKGDGVSIVDADGKPLTTVADGGKFFVKGPADKAASAVVTGSGNGPAFPVGQLWVGKKQKTQSLISVSSDHGKVSGEIKVDFTAPVVPTTPAPQPAPKPELANTGASVYGLAGLAVLLLGGGVAAVVLQRRRNKAAEQG
ncbi:TQXA domain-containing protein [Pseudonocardiaceae bacterium YIM PH 21723]|nr:TQXA domain-containing protein [Pseudonocardiaceae bacterium YIM PH 21723]